MKLIHILVLILLTTFTLTKRTNLRHKGDEADEAEQKKIESLKKDLIELKSKTEHASLINDMLEILEEKGIKQDMDIYKEISLFVLRIELSKGNDKIKENIPEYIKIAQEAVEKHKKSKSNSRKRRLNKY